jgi:hypothetical protein
MMSLRFASILISTGHDAKSNIGLHEPNHGLLFLVSLVAPKASVAHFVPTLRHLAKPAGEVAPHAPSNPATSPKKSPFGPPPLLAFQPTTLSQLARSCAATDPSPTGPSFHPILLPLHPLIQTTKGLLQPARSLYAQHCAIQFTSRMFPQSNCPVISAHGQSIPSSGLDSAMFESWNGSPDTTKRSATGTEMLARTPRASATCAVWREKRS